MLCTHFRQGDSYRDGSYDLYAALDEIAQRVGAAATVQVGGGWAAVVVAVPATTGGNATAPLVVGPYPAALQLKI